MAHRIENFFSLILGTSVCMEAVEIQISGGDFCPLVKGRRMGKSEKRDVQAWVGSSWSHTSFALSTWLSTPEGFRTLENLVGGSLGSSQTAIETQFLGLAQAVESFHRLTDESTIMPEDAFRQVKTELNAFIGDKYKKTPIEQRLGEAVRFANEPSFRVRIERLLSRLSDEGVRNLLGDRVDFEQTLRQTRNYFTHPGTSKGRAVLVDPGEIFLFNQKLRALLRLLMLLNLDFTEREVLEKVTYQSRKWRLL